MAGAKVAVGVTLAAVVGIIFQVFLKELVWLGLGIGKVCQPLGDFPYTCRRIQGPRLQACEDMWLSESTRQLFLTCSEPLSRKEWAPAMHHLNVAGRSKSDAIIAMDIDSPEGDSFVHRVLSTPGFTGTNGDGLINLVGFGGVESAGKITLAVVNTRPSVDPETGVPLDNARTGANSTIEIFETGQDATELRHVRTVFDPRIVTPNRVAFASEDPDAGFYFTNDHGQRKTGLRSQAAMVAPWGDVTFCPGSSSADSGCEIVAGGFKFPNGLIRSRKDGLVYVPTSGGGAVHVFRPSLAAGGSGKPTLRDVGTIPVGYTIDNLYEDADGEIFAAVFSKSIETLLSFHDPMHKWPRSAIVRIRRGASSEGGDGEGERFSYTTEKILEDRDQEVLPGSTSVVHDAKTGRLFLAGVATPFIAVCDPK